MRFALDIGGTFVKCACVDDDGTIVRDGQFPTDPTLSTDVFGKVLVQGGRDFLSEGGETIAMAGAGMAGFTDGSRGITFALRPLTEPELYAAVACGPLPRY